MDLDVGGNMIAEPITKTCSKCGEVKPPKEFYKNKRHKDGLQYNCKMCQAEYGKKYRATHEEERREYRRRYRETHKEERRKDAKKYRAVHKEERREYKERHREIHRDEKRAYDRAYQKTETGKWISRKAHSKRRAREQGSCEVEGVNLFMQQMKKQKDFKANVFRWHGSE